MPKDPCSPQAATLTKIAMLIGAEPEVKNLDDVLKKMQALLPEYNLTRESLTASIVEATEGAREAATALQKKLMELRREARNDQDARKQIDQLRALVANNASPPKARRRKSPPEAIKKLREERDKLKDQLAQNDPAAREKVKKRIEELEKHIAAGTMPPSAPRKAAPADLQALRDRRDELMRQMRGSGSAARSKLWEQIRELDAHLKAGTEPTPKPRKAAPAEIEALRKRRDELRKKVREGGPTVRAELRDQIAALQKHIRDGTHPDTETRKAAPEDLQKLRDERDTLRRKLAQNSPERIAEMEARLKELEGHLSKGTLPQSASRPEADVPQVVKELRDKMDVVKRALSKSEPAIKKRLTEQIEALTDRLEDGVTLPGPKPDEPALSKELEQLTYQRDRMRREINARIEAMKPRGFWKKAGVEVSSVVNLSRAILTLDFPLLRQGMLMIGRPRHVASAFTPMLRAFASAPKAHAINQEILNRPNAYKYDRSGLYIAPSDGSLSQMEEAFMSRWVKKVPIAAGANRAYITFLNKLRADVFDAMVETLPPTKEATQEEMTQIARYINVATGRGSLAQLENAAVGLNTIFFAPRFVASRFQYLLGTPLMQSRGRARTMIATEYARTLIGIHLVLALGALAGGEIEDDPRSTDFLKIKFGNTRLDPLAGLSQVTRLIARTVSGEKKTAEGEIVPIRGEDVPYGGETVASNIGNFFRSKFAPVTGAIFDSLTGENIIGEPVTPLGATARLFTPIGVEDIIGAIEEHGIAKGTALGIVSFFGMGMQNYEERQRKTRAQRKKRETRKVRD